MSFINTYIFKAEISKPALLDFISKAPPEYFCFLVPAGNSVYGIFLGDDIIELFCNEFPVKALDMIKAEELKIVLSSVGCKVWGNQELLKL